MSQARVAEAWQHYPLQIKLQGKSFTVRAMTLDDGEALQASGQGSFSVLWL